jgi:hypothetical protein
MEALTKQNAHLLRQISGESSMNVEAGDEHGSWSIGRNDGEVNPENGGGPRDDQYGEDSTNNQHGRGSRWPKKKLREVVASLDEKYNRLQ